MKRDILLLLDADADSAHVVGSAAALSNLHVQWTRTSRDLFQLVEQGLTDVAIIVLDADPGVHAMAVLEALDACNSAAPIIILSSLEEAHLRPVAIAHGAKDCLGKPISFDRLNHAIAKFARPLETKGCWCDVWGHPCACPAARRHPTNDPELCSAEN